MRNVRHLLDWVFFFAQNNVVFVVVVGRIDKYTYKMLLFNAERKRSRGVSLVETKKLNNDK